jgi:cation transport ATPase
MHTAVTVAIAAAAAYAYSGVITYRALRVASKYRDSAVWGVSGMIVSALFLGGALEHLLP